MADAKRKSADIAVVGMACWYPGSRTLKEFWENILARRQQFRRMPDSRLPLDAYHDPDKRSPDKTYGTQAAVLDGFEFDWRERRIPKSTFESTDIVHWLALEVAMKALDDSGQNLERLQALRTGVILGNTLTGEWTRTNAMRLRWPFVERVLRETAKARGQEDLVTADFLQSVEQAFKSVFPSVTEDTLAGALSNTIAGRVCNALDLHGGGYTVDGACSSSLLAVITAARNLASGDLDVAFAGGLDISLDTFELIGFAKVGALTPDEMRVYDKRANGFIPGEGCGFVVLKRLEDAKRDGDRIYAVVKGWGLSSDGKGGLTAPSVDGQANAIGDAYRMAGYGLEAVTFIEGHGTATTLGDKVEIGALCKVLGSAVPPHTIGLTSLKSVMGHTKAAAGIGGFIKAALAANQRVAPPTAGVDDPNELFAKEAKHFLPLMVGRKFSESQVLRCGVSAMGFGGINTHVTLESHGEVRHEHRPDEPESLLWASAENAEVLTFSAHSQSALRREIDEALADVRQLSRAELTDLAAHLASKSKADDQFRAVAVVRSPEAAYQALQKIKVWLDKPLAADSPQEAEEPSYYAAAAKARKRPRIAFVFPGQGSQRPAMASQLVRRHGWAWRMHGEATQIARDDNGKRLLEPLDHNGPRARLDETETVQPAISLANALWHDALVRVGIVPTVVAGHSLGELSALYAAGAFGFGALMRLATARGKLMGKSTPTTGTMIYLACDVETAQSFLSKVDGTAVVANVNSREQTVISGTPDALEKILASAAGAGIKAGRLPVSNAFHSPLMAEASQQFGAIAAQETIDTPRRPLIRGSDGQLWEPTDEVAGYLSRQIVSQVDFVSTSQKLAETSDIILEVGPGSVLTGLLRKNLAGSSQVPIVALDPRAGSSFEFKAAVARCFVRGASVRWAEMHRERFSRPYVSPAKRIFIVSPTEKPLALPESPAVAARTTAAAAAVPARVAMPTPVVERPTPESPVVERRVVAPEVKPSAAPSSAVAVASPTVTVDTMLESVLTSVATITSFDVKTLNGEMRLLDDLNLDSIKLTELVYLVGKSQGIENLQAQIQNPNMSLREFAETLMDQSADLRPPAAAEAVPIPAPAATVSPPGQEPPAEKPRAQKPQAPTPPAQAPRVAESLKSKNRQPWVRNFTETFAPQPIREKPAAWSGVKVAVLGHESDDHLARGLAERLSAEGAEARVELAAHEAKFAPRLDDRELTIVCLPAAREARRTIDAEVKLLTGFAQAKTPRQHEAMFVQVDDGRFGQTASSTRVGSAKAFAQSIAYERPDCRVTTVSFAAPCAEDPAWILAQLGLERSRPSRRAVVGFGEDGARAEADLTLDRRADYQARATQLTADDVVIVSGGAKGITAACAHALAVRTGSTMALVGSSPLSAADLASPEHPITKTLGTFRESGLKAEYFQCDIADPASVERLVADVTQRLGRPSGIVHGAGINVMRPASTVDELEAKRELSVKVSGLENLLDATSDLKLVVALGSVIGVVGMPGNSWYGFANEAMDLTLRQYRAKHPRTETATIAYSVWSEIGMGARMGSDKHLEAKGIGCIHPDAGVSRFLELVEKRAPDHQTTVTSRLGSIGRGRPEASRPTGAHDYAANVVAFHAGVEAVASVQLNPATHGFLLDHNYKGSLLFPTVQGLEAMAQVASLLRPELGSADVVIEGIKLTRPIPVSKAGLTIEIHAELIEAETPTSEDRIRVGIRCPLTGFEHDHFAADFIVGRAIETSRKTPGDPSAAQDLGIDPGKDLYGRILFQGPMFQRLASVLSLVSDNENTGHTIYQSRAERRDQEGHLLGDPFARDSLLQSAQITIPQNQCLPIEIGRIEIKAAARAEALRTCVSDVVRTDAKTFQATIEVLDAEGAVVERLTDYRLHLLEKRTNLPKASELIPSGPARATAPEAAMPAEGDLLAPYRPVISQLHFDAIPDGPQGQGIFVRRFIPDFKTFSMLSRSIYFSHFFNWMGEAREIGLAPVLRELRDLTASGKWGMITNWSEIEILGDCRNDDRIIESRTWVSRKLMGKSQSSSVLSFDWVARGPSGELERIATGHMGFTWAEILDHGVVKAAALPPGLQAFMNGMMAKTDAEDSYEPALEPFRELSPGEVIFEAPRGPNSAVPLASKVFETGLTNANLVGNVYFVNYSTWMGSLRDRFFYELIPDAFRGIGEAGEMTCVRARIQHLREAMPFDDIQVTMGLCSVSENGMQLTFEFFKVGEDGSREKLAYGTHELVWTQRDAAGNKISAKLPDQLLAGLLQCAEGSRTASAA
jgi:enediyne polyketide synthase